MGVRRSVIGEQLNILQWLPRSDFLHNFVVYRIDPQFTTVYIHAKNTHCLFPL